MFSGMNIVAEEETQPGRARQESLLVPSEQRPILPAVGSVFFPSEHRPLPAVTRLRNLWRAHLELCAVVDIRDDAMPGRPVGLRQWQYFNVKLRPR